MLFKITGFKSIVPLLGTLRQEDQELEGYRVSVSRRLKKTKKKKKKLQDLI